MIQAPPPHQGPVAIRSHSRFPLDNVTSSSSFSLKSRRFLSLRLGPQALIHALCFSSSFNSITSRQRRLSWWWCFFSYNCLLLSLSGFFLPPPDLRIFLPAEALCAAWMCGNSAVGRGPSGWIEILSQRVFQSADSCTFMWSDTIRRPRIAKRKSIEMSGLRRPDSVDKLNLKEFLQSLC